MNEITPNEYWILTRQRIDESIYRNFEKISKEKTNALSRITGIIDIIAKELNRTPEDIRQFLLTDKILDTYAIESDKAYEEKKAILHAEKEKNVQERDRVQFERDELDKKMAKVKAEKEKRKNK